MYGTIAVKLIAGMVGVLFFLRVVGKTQMAQITPLDTVSSFVVGALVGGVIYNPDMDVLHLIYALVIWTFFNLIIRYSLRFRIMRKIINGDAVYIVKDGRLNLRVFKRNGLEMEQFRTLVRENGIFSMFDVEDILFETNGKITISKKGATSESYLFINNGTVVQSSLENARKSDKWLAKELKRMGCTEVSELFCVEWTPRKGFYMVSRNGKVYYDYAEKSQKYTSKPKTKIKTSEKNIDIEKKRRRSNNFGVTLLDNSHTALKITAYFWSGIRTDKPMNSTEAGWELQFF